MANVYWVAGGTGNWSSSTNWSTASGGSSGASAPGTSDVAIFDLNSGVGTATVNSNVVIQALTMTGFTGTLAFGTNSISLNGTGTIFTGDTTFTVTGTPVINCTNSTSATRTITPTTVTESNSISFNITAGTGSLSLNPGSYKDLNFTGFSGTVNSSNWNNVYGSLTLSSTMTLAAGTIAPIFASTSGIKTITTNGITVDFPLTFNGVGGTWQLQDALTVGTTRTVTLTNGSLDLNNNNLTCGRFSSNNSNTRSILFGTGQIYLSSGGTATVWNFATATGYTCTGSNVINLTSNNKTQTRAINYGGNSGGGGVEAYAPNVNVTAGSDTIQLSAVAVGTVKNLDFTGFSGNVIYNSIGIVGNITLSPTMTISISSTPWQLSCTAAGTKTIKTNGVPMPGLYIGSNATTTVFQLLDNLTIGGGYNLTHINGTLDLNGYTLTCNNWASNYSNTRRIAFGNGTVIITGSGATTWNCGATNLTTTGTGTIKMISSSAKTFAGGGANYAATLDHGGTGDLTISGSNTFANITSSISGTAAVNIFFTAGTTTTLSNFTASGTSGNILTLSSTTTSNFTLSKASSNVIINYVSISYSTATGGASWNAAAGNSTNGTNNSGWNFIGLVMRLNSSGNLLINGILDEVTNAGSGVPARTDTSNLYANTFDEVTINSIGGGLARKIFNDGTYQISGIFDEVTGAV